MRTRLSALAQDVQVDEKDPRGLGNEGGPEETVLDFVREAQEARRVLSLYEATLNKDEDRLVQLLGGPEVTEKFRELGGLALAFKLWFLERMVGYYDEQLTRPWRRRLVRR